MNEADGTTAVPQDKGGAAKNWVDALGPGLGVYENRLKRYAEEKLGYEPQAARMWAHAQMLRLLRTRPSGTTNEED